jgi:anaerobic sulfite reductase subunit A
MGYQLTIKQFNDYIKSLSKDNDIYGTVSFENNGKYSDTTLTRYEQVSSFEQMDFSKKSNYSPKEVYLPMRETLFTFVNQDYVKPDAPTRKKIIFLRACDIHAIKRTDQIYFDNKFSDVYYQEKRDLVKFVLVGCSHEYDNCTCVSYQSNKTDKYDMAINIKDDIVQIDVKDDYFKIDADINIDVKIDYVSKNRIKVELPQNPVALESVIDAPIWDEYSTRCVGCGACNFVCPTCTCFSMQDIYYTDNKEVGERRRVQASCMIDGFTNMAGGHSFRDDKKDRYRFKVMHKVSDFKDRFGYNMCIGCGRCDDVCPELILFSKSVNKLTNYAKEGNTNE